MSEASELLAEARQLVELGSGGSAVFVRDLAAALRAALEQLETCRRAKAAVENQRNEHRAAEDRLAAQLLQDAPLAAAARAWAKAPVHSNARGHIADVGVSKWGEDKSETDERLYAVVELQDEAQAKGGGE